MVNRAAPFHGGCALLGMLAVESHQTKTRGFRGSTIAIRGIKTTAILHLRPHEIQHVLHTVSSMHN